MWLDPGIIGLLTKQRWGAALTGMIRDECPYKLTALAHTTYTHHTHTCTLTHSCIHTHTGISIYSTAN